MGAYDFRPSSVYRTATQLVASGRAPRTPSWYTVVGKIPTSQILVRNQPVQHSGPKLKKHKRKPSKLFRPQQITYEEDELRKQFFSDHPWELARPRTVLETDGKDYQNYDWSRIRQAGRIVDGESVIQRQMWLMKNHKTLSKQEAYDLARKEFYTERLNQEVEARVAKEEALTTSAYFGKSRVQIGAELEDRSYERWRSKAQQEFVKLEQRRASALPSFTQRTEGETPPTNIEANEALLASSRQM